MSFCYNTYFGIVAATLGNHTGYSFFRSVPNTISSFCLHPSMHTFNLPNVSVPKMSTPERKKAKSVLFFQSVCVKPAAIMIGKCCHQFRFLMEYPSRFFLYKRGVVFAMHTECKNQAFVFKNIGSAIALVHIKVNDYNLFCQCSLPVNCCSSRW